MRPGVAITQHNLDHAEAVDNRDRHLIAPLLAVSQGGLRQVQSNCGSQGFVSYERFLRARLNGARNKWSARLPDVECP